MKLLPDDVLNFLISAKTCTKLAHLSIKLAHLSIKQQYLQVNMSLQIRPFLLNSLQDSVNLE